MKNLKIKQKLLISFLIIIGLMIMVGAIGLRSQVRFEAQINEIGGNRLPSVFALQVINETQKTIRSDEREILNPLTSVENVNIQIREIERVCFPKITKAWKIYEPLPQTKEEAGIWNEFVPLWEKCLEHHDKLLGMAKQLVILQERDGEAAKDSAAMKLLKKMNAFQHATRADRAQAEILLNKLVDINTEVGNDVVKQAEEETSQNTIYIFVVLILGITFAILLATYISSSIAKGVGKIQNAAQNLANGNLDNRLDIDSKDEIGQLADSFKLVSSNLNAIVSAVDTTITLTKSGKIEQIHFNEKEYSGTYREIVAGLNEMAVSTSTPLTEVLTIIQKMAEGDLSMRMTSDNLQGSWAALRDAVHKTIDANMQVVENAQLIANGDLTVKIRPRSDKDELLLALADMLEKLNAIMAVVIESADNVAAGSAQISSTAAMMAQGSNEQASSAEEISSSVEEMTSTIRQNTENAMQTEVISREGAKGMMEVGSAAQKSMEAIRKINDRITVVDDIAEKTDILAINAAIEAARAGEHGKGFAVVAAEVRKLAEMSQKAAKEINELSRVNLQMTEDAGVLMQTMMPNVQKTAQLVQEIAAASSEQSSGAQQIAKAVEQFSQVTQQNSAASEELSSSSEELASQAETLKETIRFFKINQKSIISNIKHEKHATIRHKAPEAIQHEGVKIKLTNQPTDDGFETF